MVVILSSALILAGLLFGSTIHILLKRVEQFKTRDFLTSLYNRKTFLEFLAHEIIRSDRQQYRFAVLIADIDNFKAVSDMYGHDAGDRCLRQFSRSFTQSIRKGDIAARYGGDTFAAVLPVCDETQTSIVAKRLLDNIRSRPFELPDGISIPATASIGVAVYPDHARDEQSLLLVSHSMVQQAKLAGRDCVKRPSDDMDIETMRHARGSYLFLMDAIRKKQIVPYFQPIVSAKNQTLLAYEVLTRIITSERVIAAGEFIEAAEDIGVVGKIDYQLMEKAFVEMKRSKR
jgi:diguanylate cyclase (GGDEF)-like protein